MPRSGTGIYVPPSNSWNQAINGVPATAADWNALLNDIVSAMTQSVSRDGQSAMTGNLPMAGNKITGLGNATATGDALTFAQLFSQGQQQDIASAATMDIGAPLTTLLNVTGTATITSFGTNYNGPRFLRFAAACTLTNSASLVLPGGANLTTAAGDSAIVVPLGTPATGWRVVVYERASGAAFDGSVTTNSIQNDAVTFAKMQNIATGTILGRSTAGTGDVEALTGTQATALLSAASETVSGRVELATNAEAQTGTDTTRAVTPANLNATVLGMGQTWQNVTGSRAVNTTYTNTTGKPIQVQVTAVTNAGVQGFFLVDGNNVVNLFFASGGAQSTTFTLTVTPGSTYRLNASSLTSWWELRS